MNLESETGKAHSAPAIEPSPEARRTFGVKRPDTRVERLLFILSRYREASIAVVAVVLVAYFQFGSGGQFLTAQLLGVVFRETSRIGLIAIAEAMLMITGEIDLSVSSTFAFAPYVMALLSLPSAHFLGLNITLGVPLAVGAIAGVALGVLVGAINGMITVRFRVPSLITTVGTLFLLQGVCVWIYNSQPIMTPVQEPFNEFFGESLYNPRADAVLSWHSLSAFTAMLWTTLIAAIMALVLSRTTFGLHTIATGSNIVGSREIGVNTDRVKVYNFMIAGGFAAFSGILNTMQFSSADPAAGAGFLSLEAIAAAVIGGTSLLGGSGTVVGALIGAFVIATLKVGLVMVGAQATVSDVFLGAGILAAMLLNVQVDRLRARRRI